VSIPARLVDEEFFRDGKMFDGSSIAGWKGINESDMILMPDASTAVIDPFFEETTVDIRCDVIEPTTMQGYERDPRFARQACESYLKSTASPTTPSSDRENEFFIFDSVRFGNDLHGCFYSIDSVEGAWNSPRSTRTATRVIVRDQGRLLPPCRQSMRSRTSVRRCASPARRWDSRSRCTITRSRPPARPRSASRPARWCRRPTSTDPQVRPAERGGTATARP